MGSHPLEQNAILKELEGAERAKVLADGSLRRFDLRATVYQAHERIEDAYFPLDCVLSVVSLMQDGAMIEIGTIGHEGTTGIPMIMGGDTTANHAFCQVNGDAWKMSARMFRQLLVESNLFRDLVNRYLQGYLNMLGQFAACNRLHSVYEQTARWILMTQDRVSAKIHSHSRTSSWRRCSVPDDPASPSPPPCSKRPASSRTIGAASRYWTALVSKRRLANAMKRPCGSSATRSDRQPTFPGRIPKPYRNVARSAAPLADLGFPGKSATSAGIG